MSTEWSITPYTKGDMTIDGKVMAELAGAIVNGLVSDSRMPAKRFRSCAVQIEGRDFCAAATDSGTLVDVLHIIEPHMPPGFVPRVLNMDRLRSLRNRGNN